MSSPQGNARKVISPSSTYAGQSSLPRLPIPTLEETLERFPAVVSAIVNKKDMKKCQEEITKFLETDGPVLQKLLIEYEQRGRAEGTVGSFVEEFWTDAYLTPDSSVVMNLNPFFVLEVCHLCHCFRSSSHILTIIRVFYTA
jgi:carnitine O-acetyltransferase